MLVLFETAVVILKVLNQKSSFVFWNLCKLLNQVSCRVDICPFVCQTPNVTRIYIVVALLPSAKCNLILIEIVPLALSLKEASYTLGKISNTLDHSSGLR